MFDAEQIKALEAKLDPSHIQPARQFGPKGDYLEGWFVMQEANRIFGFDGWSYSIVEAKCVAQGPRPIGRDKKDGFGVTYIAKVSVIADLGAVTREDFGAGHGYDLDLGLAHESAIKEAVTDALKRALRSFGNVFGLALYDKSRANVGPEEQPEPAKPASKAPSREGYTRLEQSMRANRTADDLIRWWNDPECIAERDKLPPDWKVNLQTDYRMLGTQLRAKETKADNSAVQNMMAG